MSSPASQLRLEKDAVLCPIALLSHHTPAFCAFKRLTGAKLAAETKRGLTIDLAHACVHVLGDELRWIQVCCQTGSVRVIQRSGCKNEIIRYAHTRKLRNLK